MPSAARSDARELCPLCRKPADAKHRPFCSQGCRDRDLLKWLGDGYRIAGPPADPDAAADASDGLDREGQAPV